MTEKVGFGLLTNSTKDCYWFIHRKAAINYTFYHFSLESLTVKLTFPSYYQISPQESFLELSNLKYQVNSSEELSFQQYKTSGSETPGGPWTWNFISIDPKLFFEDVIEIY